MAYEEKKVEVSVIFVNYNATDMLIEAIRSVKKHTQHVSYELIVVDNASPDRGIQRIKDTFEEEIKVIVSTRNLGFGGANNLGVAEAKGKYVFFLNPDTLLLNDVISLLYAYCENNADKRIGALGTILLSQAKLPTNSFGVFLSPCNVIASRLGLSRGAQVLQRITQPTNVDFITGADLFVPRSVLQEVGCFDTRFFMYCEEVDLQQRMAQKGYQRIVLPHAGIVHFDGGSYQQVKKRSASRRQEQDRSICIYIKKHYSRPAYYLFLLAFILIRWPAYINPHYLLKENWRYFKMLISPKLSKRQ